MIWVDGRSRAALTHALDQVLQRSTNKVTSSLYALESLHPRSSALRKLRVSRVALIRWIIKVKYKALNHVWYSLWVYFTAARQITMRVREDSVVFMLLTSPFCSDVHVDSTSWNDSPPLARSWLTLSSDHEHVIHQVTRNRERCCRCVPSDRLCWTSDYHYNVKKAFFCLFEHFTTLLNLGLELQLIWLFELNTIIYLVWISTYVFLVCCVSLNITIHVWAGRMGDTKTWRYVVSSWEGYIEG